MKRRRWPKIVIIAFQANGLPYIVGMSPLDWAPEDTRHPNEKVYALVPRTKNRRKARS